MSLAPGIRSMRIKADAVLRGYSLGLDWPLMFCEVKGFGGWAVYLRATGEVTHWFPHRPNVHGWSNAKQLACRTASPPHDPAINMLHDMET